MFTLLPPPLFPDVNYGDARAFNNAVYISVVAGRYVPHARGIRLPKGDGPIVPYLRLLETLFPVGHKVLVLGVLNDKFALERSV